MPLPTSGLIGYWDSQLGVYQDTGSGTTTPVTANGQPVGHVVDQSNNGNYLFSSSTGQRPTYTTNATPNGSPAWTFAGSPVNFLGSNNFAGGSLSQPYTITVVCKQAFLAAFDIMWGNNSSSPNTYCYFNGTAGYPYVDLNAGTDTYACYLDTQWHVLSWVVNGSSTTMRIDGQKYYDGSFGSPGANGLAGFCLGAYGNGSSFPWKGQIAAATVYNGDQTANLPTIESYLANRFGTNGIANANYLMVVGDSISRWTDASTSYPNPTVAWPIVMRGLVSPTVGVLDAAVSGRTVATFPGQTTNSFGYGASTLELALTVGSGAFAHTTDAAINFKQAGGKAVLVIDGGIDDMLLFSSPPATIAAALKSYCQARKSAGWDKIVVCTLISNGTVDANRSTLNGLIRADPSYYDALIDFGANSTMGATGAYSNSTYFQNDGTHPTAAGEAIMASIAAPVIQNLLAPPSLIPLFFASAGGY